MLVALSGGADSVALLLYLLERGEAEAAAHCNFHLRGSESDRDELFVRQLCQEYGVKLHVKHFDTHRVARETGESIEMAARRLRYDWFDELCLAHHYTAVAVAHHQEDNAETLLLNLVRGTGLRGLCGMLPVRDKVCRPLLGWTKKQILAFLEARHQTYVTDSTNADTAYKRNFVRHEVLPQLQQLNPNVVQTLNAMAQNLQAVEQIYQKGLADLTAAWREPTPGGWRMPVEWLAQKDVVSTLLHEWLSPLGFTAAQIKEAEKMRVGALLETGSHWLTRTRSHLELARKTTPLQPLVIPQGQGSIPLPNGMQLRYAWQDCSPSFSIPKQSACVALDADRIKGAVQVRSAEQADRFVPLGMKGSKLVSDYLTDRHRSRIEKMQSYVLTDEEGILWLVNERPAQRMAVSAATKKVLVLSTKPLP